MSDYCLTGCMLQRGHAYLCELAKPCPRGFPQRGDKRSPETRLQAWRRISPTLPDGQRLVMERLMATPDGLTVYDLSEKLGWPIDRITAELTGLTDSRYVADSGQKKPSPLDGTLCMIWRVTL